MTFSVIFGWLPGPQEKICVDLSGPGYNWPHQKQIAEQLKAIYFGFAEPL